MLTKAQKGNIVEDLSKKFSEEKIAIFSQVRNISAGKLNTFRRELKKMGAELKITKKTLMKRALASVGIAVDPERLEGEVGIIFGYNDQAGTAKLAQKFRKENETFKILAGLLEKNIISSEQVLTLAKLPPREQLLAQLVSMLSAPLRSLANVLQGNQRNLVVVINKIKESRS